MSDDKRQSARRTGKSYPRAKTSSHAATLGMTRPPYAAAAEVCCLGKDKLSTMNLARGIAKRMSKVRDEAVSAYKCPHCDAYHVGENSRKRRFHGKPKS